MSYDRNLKIWSGPIEANRFGPKDSVGSVLLQYLLETPDHIAQVCYQTGTELTNRQFASLSIQIAKYFERKKLPQGTVIGLCAGNSDYVTPLFLGTLMAGLTLSTLDPSFGINGIKHIYSISKPKVMFCDGDIYAKVRQALHECGLTSTDIYTIRKHIEGVSSVEELLNDEKDLNPSLYKCPQLLEGPNQVAAILCSSGSTGLPKGVNMSHAALLALGESLLDNESSSNLLCFSSLYWLSAVISILRCILTRTTRIISANPFCPEDFFAIVERYKVTVVMGPPSHMAMCLTSSKLPDSDLSSIVEYGVGGSRVCYSLIEKFKKYSPNAVFNIAYGMSEVCVIASSGEAEPTSSVGKLKTNIEVKVINELGKAMGPNEIGEICIRTQIPSSGYCNNPEATKAIYDNNLWIHSGDVGYFNNSMQLYIVDRKKDILKYNNFHFTPSSIERVLSEIQGVAEVCVVGIPDNCMGFLPAAAVIKSFNSTITEAQIYEHASEHLEHFEQLRGGIYFVDNFPRTMSGKTVRSEVAKLCEQLRNVK
ncbi:uncharacterized protein LOC101891121 [Musca domestica]|uniref:4-coumarate--CoA ligase-like 7 n=1 Tax=Musca domestica TaxID=7370 RepID=A0A1I8N1I4_MUSDO|nr:uncharacterized protein LOC101891121 [Musca domestica]